jgi:hypothetical protein
MPTNSALSTQKFQKSLLSLAAPSPIQRVMVALKTKAGTRFAKIAGLSFAMTLPALGIVDPKVLLSSGLSDAHAVEALVSRAEVALRSMAVMELFVTGGAAVLAMAAMAGVGYLRARYKEAGLESAAE